MKGQITENILQKFTEATGIKARWENRKQNNVYKNVDGIVNININGGEIELPVEVRDTVVNSNVPQLIERLRMNGKLLILAETITPKIEQVLKQNAINYIDAAGNACIIDRGVFIYLEGRKPEMKNTTANKAKAFSKTGLKVIYQFLENPDLINGTIREIAKRADVSLDTVHKTIQGLKEAEYLIKVDNKNLMWDNYKRLLQKWIEEFETRLKPTIHIGNFRFLKEDDFYNWKNIQFKNNDTCWSGEPGGELLTGYLKPEILTIYTIEGKGELIKNYKIIPDNKGYIQVYKKFWKEEERETNIAPPIIVYADLVNTGTSRNLETAKKIYE